MACNYLPDGCTQAGLDAYYGYDQVDPRDEEDGSPEPEWWDEESRPICIVVSFEYPPIPIRSFDWAAWQDGREEFGPYGRGATREAAVADLLEQIEETS